MKRYIDSKIIINWWGYYLLKWGVIKRAILYGNTKPDTMEFLLEKKDLECKSLIKSVFRLIKENRLEYFSDSGEMVIYDKNKTITKRIKFDFFAIETIERLLNLKLNFEYYNPELFIVDINPKYKILVRKKISADLDAVNDVIIQDEYKMLNPYLKDAVVLDIGAYIGDSLIKFISEGAKKIYSYEPHPELYNLAIKNIELNNLWSKVEIKNFGVSDRQADVVSYEDTYLGPTGSFGLGRNQRYKRVVIKLLPLESILGYTGNIDVMKMDCEGAEFPAILSCPQHILKGIKVMVIEYHQHPKNLINYLKHIGFEVEEYRKSVLDREQGLLFVRNENLTNNKHD